MKEGVSLVHTNKETGTNHNDNINKEAGTNNTEKTHNDITIKNSQRYIPVDIVLMVSIGSIIQLLFYKTREQWYYQIMSVFLQTRIGSKISILINIFTPSTSIMVGKRYGDFSRILYSVFLYTLFYFGKKGNIIALLLSIFVFMIDIVFFASANQFFLAIVYIVFLYGLVNELIKPARRKRKTKRRSLKNN